MSAYTYGGNVADCGIAQGAIAPGAVVSFWTDKKVSQGGTGGTQITTLTLNGTGVTTITTLADGSFPEFLETTGTYSPMWADAGGNRLKIWPFASLGGGGGTPVTLTDNGNGTATLVVG